MKLFILDDGEAIAPPKAIDLEHWDGSNWVTIPNQKRSPESPTGRRANVFRFPELATSKVRAIFTHTSGADRFDRVRSVGTRFAGDLPCPAAAWKR